jgi:hypothetical protein
MAGIGDKLPELVRTGATGKCHVRANLPSGLLTRFGPYTNGPAFFAGTACTWILIVAVVAP